MKIVKLSQIICGWYAYSDQKRRFQQEYCGCSAEELEAIMRAYWEDMSVRDRLKYLHRARCATSDHLQRARTDARDERHASFAFY